MSEKNILAEGKEIVEKAEEVAEEAVKNAENKVKKVKKQKLNDQQQVRLDKMNALREMGIDPFGHAYKRTHRSSDLKEQFGEKTAEELEAEKNKVSIAGRIMTKRRMGKLGFMTF